MLNNLTNFFNLIAGKRVKTTANPDDLITLGVRDPRTPGIYQPAAIKVSDLVSSSGVTSVTGTAPVVSSGGSTPAISMPAATTLVSGHLTSTDFNTFNNKQAALVSGTNIKTINGNTLLGSGDLTISGGSGGAGIHVITKPYSGMGICLNVTQTTNNATFSLPTNQLQFFPFIPANNVTINQIVFEVSTASTGGTATVTIYSDLNGKPDSRIYQSSNISTTTTGYKTITTTETFTAGTTYWIGFCSSSGGGAVRATPQASTYAISYANGNGTQFTQNQWSYLYTTLPGSEPTLVLTAGLGPGFNSLVNIIMRVA